MIGIKKLNELFNCCDDVLIKNISINSKTTKKGDLFVCIKGVNCDRHLFVNEAIKNGAIAIVAKNKINVSVPVIYVNNPNIELTKIAKKLYDYPNLKLSIIGITGTNGKTTVATIIQDLLGNDICGYIGTNGLISNGLKESINNTSPDADKLYYYIDKLVKNKNKILSMECSSEALLRERLWGISYDVILYTNITEDHLNIHKTIDNYVFSKLKLLSLVKPSGYVILNRDDKYYELEKENAKCKVLTYGKNKKSNLRIVSVKEKINGTKIILCYKDKLYKINSPLLGYFNVYNLVAAILVLLCYKINIKEILKKINNIKPIPGRLEFLDFKQNYYIILDYAHTTDAFINVYRLLEKCRKNRIITVTGSAGSREKEKRKEMGKVILDNSDFVIFTSDDPRYEDPNDIINDLVSLSNKNNYKRIISRKEAIEESLRIANKDDIVLIAGKGRDNYMAIKNKHVKYCDYNIIKDFF